MSATDPKLENKLPRSCGSASSPCSPSLTPETSEAWDAVSRTPDGMYDSRVPISAYAYAMLDHSKKMERERDFWIGAAGQAVENCERIIAERDAMRTWILRAAPMLSTAVCIVIDEAVERLGEIEGCRAMLEMCPVDFVNPENVGSDAPGAVEKP